MSSNSARRSAVQAITTYKPEASPLNFYDTKPTDIFGCNVFTDKVMRERLPKDVYKALHKTIEFGERMDPGIAETVAAVPPTSWKTPTGPSCASPPCSFRGPVWPWTRRPRCCVPARPSTVRPAAC